MAGGFLFFFFFPAAVVCDLLTGAGISTSPSSPTVFTVGGEGRGWRQPAANEETYNHWAAKNRFHIGDFLYFRYVKNDSVLVVTRDAYKVCSADRPALRLEGGGEARYRLERSGAVFFISGAPGHCGAGQRMAVRVMALRDKQDGDGAAPAEAPAPGDDEDDNGGSFGDPGSGYGSTPAGSSAGYGSGSAPARGKTSGAPASVHASFGGGYHRVAGVVLSAAVLVILA